MIREIIFVSNQEAQKIIESDIGDKNLKEQLNEILKNGEPIYRIKSEKDEFEIISLIEVLKKSKKDLESSSKKLSDERRIVSSSKLTLYFMIVVFLFTMLVMFFSQSFDIPLIAFMAFCTLCGLGFVYSHDGNYSLSKWQHSFKEKADCYIKETSRDFIEKNKDILNFYL